MKTTKIGLYKIFRRMGIHREEIDLNTSFSTDLFFDKNDMNIFLFFIETKFNIEVNDNEMVQLRTVNNTINFIDQKISIQ